LSKIISLFGPKGGVGKTVLAVNLALSLFQESQKRILLIDLELFFPGSLPTLLNIPSIKTIAEDLIPLRKDLNSQLASGFLSSKKYGIDFLVSTSSFEGAGKITAEEIENLLSALDQYYDYIIIDLGRLLTSLNLKVLDTSNLIITAISPDILSVRQTKLFLQTLQFHNFPSQKIKIVLNFFDKKKGSPSIISSSLQKEIFAQVPQDNKEVKKSLNQGEPFVLSNPRSPISQAVKELAIKLVEGEEKDLYTLGRGLPGETREKIFDISAQRQGEISEEALIHLKDRVHKRLIKEMDLRKIDLKTADDSRKLEQLRKDVREKISPILDKEGSILARREEREKVASEILDEVLGLGPLEDLIKDPTITEIMVNRSDQIYIEREGKIETSQKRFVDDEHLVEVIRRIVGPLGRRIDESSPMVDARLPDGSRVNAIIPPLVLQGPMLTIRKFSKRVLTMDDLIKLGSLIPEFAEFLWACIQRKKNIIVSGGTGSGKTTFLNIISARIPDSERIITIEDAAELQLSQEHVGRLESRPPNIEGKGEITIRDLVRNALRMRPDRIIVGECRGGEALDMLQAMNTGHEGSLSTAHANSPRDMLARLETMVIMAGTELPSRAIREQIASAIDIIVHQSRFPDGSRKIVQISEITGMEGNVITMQDIFLFKQTGTSPQGKVEGEFFATGYIPTFVHELKVYGIDLDLDIFKTGSGLHIPQ
jgi:septum site-determining protein MinD